MIILKRYSLTGPYKATVYQFGSIKYTCSVTLGNNPDNISGQLKSMTRTSGTTITKLLRDISNNETI